MTAGAGFLAIWSDVEAQEETNYLHWLTREHTAERVSVRVFSVYECSAPGSRSIADISFFIASNRRASLVVSPTLHD